ncbi:hypothetical protein Tco_0291492, partial [Tanacetum coccineum]
MDDPNITLEEYIRLEEEKARRHEENDFMFMSASGEEQLEELNASVIMLARIQPTDSDSDVEPTYNFDFVSEVNASQIDLIRELFSKINHEQRNHKKLETIKHTSVDDQIDCNIIFYDPYVEVISGQVKHAHDAHDQKFDDFESLINNVLIEAENQRMINKEMKKKNALITKELETYKERVQDLENKLVKNTNFKSEYVTTAKDKKQSADLRQQNESTVRANEEVYRNERDTLAIEKENIKEEIAETKSQLEHRGRQAEEIQGSIASFFQSDFTPLVRRLLKSGEFNRAFAGVLNTTISVGVERNQETPGDLATGDHLSPKVKMFLIPVI